MPDTPDTSKAKRGRPKGTAPAKQASERMRAMRERAKLAARDTSADLSKLPDTGLLDAAGYHLKHGQPALLMRIVTEMMNRANARHGSDSLPVVLASEGQADTSEGQADTSEGQADTSEGQADTSEGQAETLASEGQADTSEGQAETLASEGQAQLSIELPLPVLSASETKSASKSASKSTSYTPSEQAQIVRIYDREKAQGATDKAISALVKAEIGKAPDKSNLGRHVRQWRTHPEVLAELAKLDQ